MRPLARHAGMTGARVEGYCCRGTKAVRLDMACEIWALDVVLCANGTPNDLR